MVIIISNNESIIIITHKRTWVGGPEWRVPLVTDDSSSCSPASSPSSHHLWLGVPLHLRKYIRKRNPNPANLNWIDIAGIEIVRFIFYTANIQFAPPFIDGDTDEEEDVVKRDDGGAPIKRLPSPHIALQTKLWRRTFIPCLRFPLKWLCAVDRSAYRTICVAA